MKSSRSLIALLATFAVLGSMMLVNPVKAVPTNIIDVYYNNGNPYWQYWQVSGGAPQYTSTPIQDAVDYVPSYAGIGVWEIDVHAGTYREYVTIDDTKSGLTLKGDGPVWTTLDGTGLQIPYPSPSGIRIVKADYVTIEGFTITNFAYWTAFGYGIEIVGAEPDYATDNIIYNNVIESCGSGIGMGVASSNTIADNIIQNNCYWWGGGLGVFVDNGYGNQIKDNTIYNNGYTGIELHIAGGTQVLHNQVTDNGWFGLYADGYSGGLKIQKNDFIHNGYSPPTWWGPPVEYGSGIFVISSGNTIGGWVSGPQGGPQTNTVSRNNGDGITILQGSSNEVSYNDVMKNGRHGIMVGHTSLPAHNNNIQRNFVFLNYVLDPNGYDLYDGGGLGPGNGGNWNTWLPPNFPPTQTKNF